MDAADVDAYLERITAERDTPLAELQRLHLTHVPFENLSIHLGEPIVLDSAALLEKVVVRRRGGFCYELNGLFGTLLAGLGWDVAYLGAQVFGADGALGPPLDHMTLRVSDPSTNGDEAWIVDVGFGRFTTYPLAWHAREEQTDPAGICRLVDPGVGLIDVVVNGTPQLRVDPRPLRLTDFAPTCWWQQTSPASHFAASTICSRLDGPGRITIADRLLIRSGPGGRVESTIDDDAALLDAYRDHFGVAIDRVPDVKHPRPPQ